jgi:hypothetical protein
MAPTEIWGPPVWKMFHTMAENINENVNKQFYLQVFERFKKICRYLPCPNCSTDATTFMQNVNTSTIVSKEKFKNLFYIFHNFVNTKTKKKLFDYSNINIYSQLKLIPVINKFISVYNTKGNMKQLSESFQRELILKEFKDWFKSSIAAFMPTKIPQAILPPTATEDVSSQPETKT